MGDITDIEGRSIFWDSKELEPAVTTEPKAHQLGISLQKLRPQAENSLKKSYKATPVNTYWILEVGGMTLGFSGCPCEKRKPVSERSDRNQ